MCSTRQKRSLKHHDSRPIYIYYRLISVDCIIWFLKLVAWCSSSKPSLCIIPQFRISFARLIISKLQALFIKKNKLTSWSSRHFRDAFSHVCDWLSQQCVRVCACVRYNKHVWNYDHSAKKTNWRTRVKKLVTKNQTQNDRFKTSVGCFEVLLLFLVPVPTWIHWLQAWSFPPKIPKPSKTWIIRFAKGKPNQIALTNLPKEETQGDPFWCRILSLQFSLYCAIAVARLLQVDITNVEKLEKAKRGKQTYSIFTCI